MNSAQFSLLKKNQVQFSTLLEKFPSIDGLKMVES